MTNITARQRGRHAARPVRPVPQHVPARPRVAPPRTDTHRSGSVGRLPGMELLGFYDEPYRVYVAPTRKARRTAAQPVPMAHTTRVTHSSSADLVADLWETTQLESSALEWWNPGVVARRKLGGSRVRTATAVGTLIGFALLVVLGWFVFSRPAQMEAQATVAFDVAAQSMPDALEPLKGVALSLGADTPPDLVEASTAVLSAESVTRDFFSAAGSLESSSNAAVRESAVATAGQVLETTSELSRLLAFRLATGQALVLPDVPSDPSTLDIGVVTERIAEWRAGVDATIADIPDGVLAETQANIAHWQSQHQEWQIRYLDAYRTGDAEAVAQALREQESAVVELRSDMLTGLEQAGSDIAGSIDRAAQAISDFSVAR